jgi:hypothetical protein
MRTFEDEVEAMIAVDFAVIEPHRRRGFAGLDQYRRQVEVRGVQEIATKIAESFTAYAIFDGEEVIRYPAITPFITQTLHTIPLELRRAACDRDRVKAARARGQMARVVATALMQRYRLEHLQPEGPSVHVNWDRVFEQRFGSRRRAAEG